MAANAAERRSAATPCVIDQAEQSQRIPPCRREVERALADGELRAVPMPISPGPSGSIRVPVVAELRSVVHRCPCQPMYCRSSAQITQVSGGTPLSGYWVPQVVHRKQGMEKN